MHEHVCSMVRTSIGRDELATYFKDTGIATYTDDPAKIQCFVLALAKFCATTDEIMQHRVQKTAPRQANAAALPDTSACWVCSKPLKEHPAGTVRGREVQHAFCRRAPNGRGPGSAGHGGAN